MIQRSKRHWKKKSKRSLKITKRIRTWKWMYSTHSWSTKILSLLSKKKRFLLTRELQMKNISTSTITSQMTTSTCSYTQTMNMMRTNKMFSSKLHRDSNIIKMRMTNITILMTMTREEKITDAPFIRKYLTFVMKIIEARTTSREQAIWRTFLIMREI